MADGLKDIIKRLEQQRSAIERALAALKEVDGVAGGASAAAESASSSGSEASRPATKKGRRKGGITAEGRRRLSESLKARWAAKRAPQTAYPGKKRGRKPKSAA